MQLHEWDACRKEIAPTPEWLVPKLTGLAAHGGLDLSARLDLTAWTLLFLGDPSWALWRFWIPEAALEIIDKASGGQADVWARQRWLTVTDGDVIDYDKVYDQLQADSESFAIVNVAYDEWGGEPARQEIVSRTGVELIPIRTTFSRMTQPLRELERMTRSHSLAHGGNPVARWCMDNLEVRTNRDDPEQIRPVRPDRRATGKRIDGAVSLLNAIAARLASESDQLAVVSPTAMYV